jgi:hypothetical protein
VFELLKGHLHLEVSAIAMIDLEEEKKLTKLNNDASLACPLRHWA